MVDVGTPVPRLVHLPLPLFAIPLGLGGVGLAWREAARFLGAPSIIGETLLGLTALAWLVIFGLHLGRAVRHPGALLGDLRHPVRSAFAGAVTIGLMLIAGALFPYAPTAAATLWLGAVALHLWVGVWTVRGLLLAPREVAALTPLLLIPLVGNILAPAIGVRMGYETLCWILFGIGGLLWAMIQPLILGRILTGPAMPERMRPALAILIAPPAVGAIALANLTHGFGPGPLILLGLAAFIATVMLTLVARFAQVPFSLAWWGWTFPSAAFAMSMLALAAAYPLTWVLVLGWLSLLGASVILALVAAATLRAALAGQLLLPDA